MTVGTLRRFVGAGVIARFDWKGLNFQIDAGYLRAAIPMLILGALAEFGEAGMAALA